MKWPYTTYMAQPSWFLDILKVVMNCDAEYENRMARIASRKRK